MRHATSSVPVLFLCGSFLALGVGAQPMVVAELRIEATSVVERSTTVGSPASRQALETLWVEAAQRHFGFVDWRRAADAPGVTRRLVLRLQEETSQGCLPGRLTLALSALDDKGTETTREFPPGAEELKAPCDPDWQDAGATAFADAFALWLGQVPFSPDGKLWIQSALLRKIKLADKLVAEAQHVFLPVKVPRADSESEIYVRFGKELEDGYVFVRPHATQGDRTQVFVTAFSCGDTVSSANLDADRAGFGRVWHDQLPALLAHCQFPAAFMWRYHDDQESGSFVPSGPGAAGLPDGGAATSPDGGR